MNRIAFLTILLLSLYSPHCSEAQSLFDKKYLQPEWVCQLVQVDISGNVYVASTNTNAKIVITKFDSTGNISWSKIAGLGERNFVVDFIITEEQKLVIAFRLDSGSFSSYLAGGFMGLDTSGNLLFSKVFNYNDTLNYPQNIIKDSTGFTMTLRYDDLNHDGFKLVKFDDNGAILQERFFPNSDMVRVLKLPDRSYMVCSKFDLTVYLIDRDFIQEKVFNCGAGLEQYYQSKMILGADSLVYIISKDLSNYAWVSCTDFNLTFEWSKNFALNDPTQAFYLTDIHQLSDRSWILIGNINSSDEENNQSKILIHADTSFNCLKTVSLKGSSFVPDFYSESVLSTNNEIVFTGNHVDTAGFPFPDFELIKADTSFSYICNSNEILLQEYSPIEYGFFNISNVSSEVLPSSLSDIVFPVSDYIPQYGSCDDSTLLSISDNSQRELLIYPNPTKDKITIQDNFIADSFQLFDLTGELLKNENVSTSKFEIDLSNYSNGIYFLTLIGKGNQIHKKIIKE